MLSESHFLRKYFYFNREHELAKLANLMFTCCNDRSVYFPKKTDSNLKFSKDETTTVALNHSIQRRKGLIQPSILLPQCRAFHKSDDTEKGGAKQCSSPWEACRFGTQAKDNFPDSQELYTKMN